MDGELLRGGLGMRVERCNARSLQGELGRESHGRGTACRRIDTHVGGERLLLSVGGRRGGEGEGRGEGGVKRSTSRVVVEESRSPVRRARVLLDAGGGAWSDPRSSDTRSPTYPWRRICMSATRSLKSAADTVVGHGHSYLLPAMCSLTEAGGVLRARGTAVHAV